MGQGHQQVKRERRLEPQPSARQTHARTMPFVCDASKANLELNLCRGQEGAPPWEYTTLPFMGLPNRPNKLKVA